MHRQHDSSLLHAERQGAEIMRHSRLVWCLFIICMTILAFTLLTRDSLCELRIRDGNREVAALMAYESR
ncbi:protein HokB [Serratia fonticola]|jgi:protein HokB|nr:protein HokB [Serratia fonticola]